ncbi:conserved hypothetical protein [Ricinus communis]|uniref:Uncharacterized protein n=1 Tax=Ricinus communis TaxID=3988 RepID=B9TKX5_RICCO|nr:conserved hypothetical protein [Ricinus communis]
MARRNTRYKCLQSRCGVTCTAPVRAALLQAHTNRGAHDERRRHKQQQHCATQPYSSLDRGRGCVRDSR